MANEITYSARLSVSKNNLQHAFNPSVLQITLASEVGVGGQQVIGGTAEALEMNADIADYGMAYFRNLSSAISIDISKATNTTTFDPLIRLLPGEYVIGRVASTNIWAKAITAGTNTSAVMQFQVFSP